MAKEKYSILIQGVGVLHGPSVVLEDTFNVDISSADGKKWTANVELDVTGNLEYEMRCSGISGTKWSFEVTNLKSDEKVVDLKGTTGEKFVNRSKRSGSTNP